MIEKSYNPVEVSIIDYVSPDLGLSLWFESKKVAVHYDKSTGLVTVGKQTEDLESYFKKVTSMNMQYNNFPTFVFDIRGSILFRDVLFTINKISQWSESLRLTHSVIDQSDSTNFKISEEYKGIPEWDEVFDDYFKKVQQDSRVDKNRVTMPYSLSSHYFIGCNLRSLIGLLSVLYYDMPFFYEIYGVMMESEVNRVFNEHFDFEHVFDIKDYYSKDYDSGISKYFSDSEDFTESCTKVGDYYYLQQSMSLVLYSQFIRQSDTTITGLWSALKHSDSSEFKHKTFTGDTLLNVTYMAHKDRVRKTLRDRVCWISQSDGDESDPHYWSKFINTFIKDIKLEEFKDLLPCQFHKDKLIGCKFKKDIEFRDKGIQKGYIPCAILNSNKEYAFKRLEGCPNALNHRYLDLLEFMESKGLFTQYSDMHWTSHLEIRVDKTVDDLENKVHWILNDLESNVFKKNCEELEPLNSYKLGDDNTCMMKGFALDKIAQFLVKFGCKSFLINFGGDIFGYNTSSRIRIENSDFYINLEGSFIVCTSGVNDLRGDHITNVQHDWNGTTTVVCKLNTYKPNVHRIIGATIDAIATKEYTEEDMNQDFFISHPSVKDYIRNEDIENICQISLNSDGQLLNTTYCASPFFDDVQVEIRDRMVSKVLDPFRPDLTSSSRLFDAGDNSAAADVVSDNIYGIQDSEILVYPKDTDDLGTLFEVGYAIGLNIPIMRFNETSNEYDIFLFRNPFEHLDSNQKYLFDCSKKREVISLGTVASSLGADNINPSEKIFYCLNGCKDNLMLSVNYTHVELEDGKYVIKTRDENDRDK